MATLAEILAGSKNPAAEGVVGRAISGRRKQFDDIEAAAVAGTPLPPPTLGDIYQGRTPPPAAAQEPGLMQSLQARYAALLELARRLRGQQQPPPPAPPPRY